MNRLKVLLVPALLLLKLGLFAQSSSNDSIVWKATFDYYLVTDKPDTFAPQMGLPPECFTVSHLKITNEKGDLKTLLNEMFQQLAVNRRTLYGVDLNQNYWPAYPLSRAEADAMAIRTDTVMDKHGKIKVVKTNNKLNGICMNEEWLYNRKTNKIDIEVSDVGLIWKHDPPGDMDMLNGAFKFTERMTEYTNPKPIDNPEVAWAKDFYTPIDYDTITGGHFVHGTPLVKATFNGVSADCQVGYPYTMKMTYNMRLIDWLYKAKHRDSLIAYKYESDGKVGAKLNKVELENIVAPIDTLQDEKGNQKIVRADIYSSLGGIEVVKEVSFNKKSFRFESKILRIAITVKEVDMHNGQYTGNNVPLFWIKFD